MSLISPLNFLFAGLIGFIVLLYMLRLKRKERVVSSTLLWQSAIRDLQANAPWQRLRSSLLMWLQILFLLLAVFALVRPAVKVLASGGQTIAIILDASASMDALDVAPSRFGQAQNEANRLINNLASGDGAAVIQAGARTQVLAPLTKDKNLLKRAVSRAKTQATGSNLREAIVLATSLLRGKKNAQIYVLSDGAVPPITDLSIGATGVQFVKIGRGSNNLGITALDVRRGYGGAKPEIFVTVRNYSAQKRALQLELLHDNNLIAVRPMTIEAGKQHSELFRQANFEQGIFQVRFGAGDDLKDDDTAYATLEPPQRRKVLLVSNGGNPYLEKALNLDPNLQLFRAAPDGVAAQSAKTDYDLVVLDGVAPPNLPDANQLVFNAITPLSPVEKTGVANRPSVADWDKRHPVARFAPWNDLLIADALAVKLKSWGKPIVEAERTPLIVAGERNGKRIVWCGFDVRKTDLPLKVAFPIFMTNAVTWLTAVRGASELDGAPRRAGDVIPLTVPDGIERITLTAPDGAKSTLPVANSPLLYSEADQVGLYRASGENGAAKYAQSFAISLLSKSESDIAPRDNIQIGSGKKVEAESRARANKELWGYLALLALGLLGVEWWIYHRGV